MSFDIELELIQKKIIHKKTCKLCKNNLKAFRKKIKKKKKIIQYINSNFERIV